MSKVTDMYGMFSSADSFNQPIGDWDMSNVTNVSRMFHWSLRFDQDLTRWDMRSVTDTTGMFRGLRMAMQRDSKPTMVRDDLNEDL